MVHKPRIVLWLPGLADFGGIQRHNRTLCRVLKEYAASRSVRVEIVSLRDPADWYDERYLTQPVNGCDGNRYRFAAQALASLVRPIDLLLVGVVDFGPLVIPARLLRPHMPILTIAYGIEVWKRRSLMERAALRYADRIMAISAYTARQVVERQGTKQTKVRVVPIPLDPDFRAAAEAWRRTNGVIQHANLLSIARMSSYDREKGIDCVIAALEYVRAYAPDVTYTVIGDGDDRPRLEQLAVQRGVATHVRFAGRIPDDQLHAYLSGADVFVLPSRKEGFGIVFLEAMHYGKPVIAGAHGGSPEVVIDGETGLLVRNGDIAELALAIVALLQDVPKRDALGDAGKRRVDVTYAYRSFSDAITQMLDELLGAR